MRATCAIIFNSSSLLALNLSAMLMVYVVLFRLPDIRIFYGHFLSQARHATVTRVKRTRMAVSASGAAASGHRVQWRCRGGECRAADEGQPTQWIRPKEWIHTSRRVGT